MRCASCKAEVNCSVRIATAVLCKDCSEKRELAALKEAFAKEVGHIGVPARYASIRPSEMDLGLSEHWVISDSSRSEYNAMRAWAKEPKSSVWIQGNTGTGKTTLSIYAMLSIIEPKILSSKVTPSCRFISETEMLRRVKPQNFKWGEGLEDEWNKYLLPRFLVVDDMCLSEPTDSSRTDVCRLIYSRYDEQKITVFTSNSDVSAVSRLYGDAVHSRLLDMTSGFRIKLSGKSLRKK